MLNDVYEEQLVSRPTPLKVVFLKGLVYMAAIAIFLGGFFFKPLFIAGLAAIFGAYYLTRRFDVEFEYIYVNGEMDIDKILGKSVRKRLVTVDMTKLESMEPADGSKPLMPQGRNDNTQCYDCTSRVPGAVPYLMIVRGDSGVVRILFEPKDAIVEAIEKIAPRKVKKA